MFCGCVLAVSQELDGCSENLSALEDKSIYYLVLHRESLLTHTVNPNKDQRSIEPETFLFSPDHMDIVYCLLLAEFCDSNLLSVYLCNCASCRSVIGLFVTL